MSPQIPMDPCSPFTLSAGCESFMVWMSLQRLDLGMVLLEPHRMSHQEIRVVADVREMTEMYEKGQIADLPPSGTWAYLVDEMLKSPGRVIWSRWAK